VNSDLPKPVGVALRASMFKSVCDSNIVQVQRRIGVRREGG